MKNSTITKQTTFTRFSLSTKHFIWMMVYTFILFSSISLWAQTQCFNLCNYAVTPNYPIAINNVPGDLSGVTYNPLTNTLFMVQNGTPTIYETMLNGFFKNHKLFLI